MSAEAKNDDPQSNLQQMRDQLVKNFNSKQDNVVELTKNLDEKLSELTKIKDEIMKVQYSLINAKSELAECMARFFKFNEENLLNVIASYKKEVGKP